VASNITCDGTQMGVRIKSRRGRGGGAENVRFDNWTMQNVGTAINITSYYMTEGEMPSTEPEPVSKRTPVFRNISVSNITLDHARVAIDVEGLPEMPIANLRIHDVEGSEATCVKARHTSGMELRRVELNAGHGPVYLIRDAADLELDGVTSPKPPAATPVIRLDHCPGAVVRNSRAFAGTGVFLSVGAGELKSVALEGNVLGRAKRATEESAKGYELTPEPPTEKTAENK
jgi:polygalacturonase